MRSRRVAVGCLVAVCLLATAAGAAEKGDKQVRFGLLYSLPTDDLTVGMQKTELDDTLGFEAGFEFLVTDRIGIEPTLGFVDYDVTVTEPGFPDQTGSSGMTSFRANVNFHFQKEGGLDFFIGPTVGYAFWDDLDLSGFPMPVATDDEFLYGLNLGLDCPLGDGPWSIDFGIDYLLLEVNPPGGTIGVDPVQVSVGVGYSF